jgi:S1-C subfamily serine protease
VTLGKRGDLHARRQAIAQMRDLARSRSCSTPALSARATRLWRNGGYNSRVMKAGFRYGDNAPMAVIEFVDRDVEAKGKDSGPVHFAPVVKRVAPAVVNVYARSVVQAPTIRCSTIRCSSSSSAFRPPRQRCSNRWAPA